MLGLVMFAMAAKTNLALQLEVGKTYPMRSVSTILINQELMGQKIETTMVVTGAMDFRVTAVNGQSYSLDTRYTLLIMEVKSPMGDMSFSSESGASDAMSVILAKMKEQSFQVEMNTVGRVLTVNGLDELFAASVKGLADFSDEQKAQVVGQVKQAYGDQALKGSIETITAIYPEAAVAEGDSWQSVVQLESGMAATQTSTYTFKGQEGGFYLVTGQGTIETADKDAYIQSNGMDMKYDLKGTMTSELKIDQASGWVSEAKIEQAISGKATVKANGAISEDLELPMELKTSTIYTN